MSRALPFAIHPTQGEVLRLVVAAFDLRPRAGKRVGDRLDRAAREGMFAPDLVDELLEGAIREPLRGIDDEFGEFLERFVRWWLLEYTRIVTRVPVDGLTRDEVMTLLLRNLADDVAADFLRAADKGGFLVGDGSLLLAGMRGVDAARPLAVTMALFAHRHGMRVERLVQQLCSAEGGPDRQEAARLMRWMRDGDPPDLQGLRRVRQWAVRARFSAAYAGGPATQAALLFRSLLIARALQYCLRQLPTGSDFDAQVLARMSPGVAVRDIGLILSDAVRRKVALLPPALMRQGLEADHATRLDRALTDAQIADAAAALARFERSCVEAAVPWATDWLLSSCRARLSLWRHDPAAALTHYETALRHTLHTGGRWKDKQRMLGEALYTAARLRNRPAVKRLLVRGEAMDLTPPVLGRGTLSATDSLEWMEDVLAKHYAHGVHMPR